MRGHSLRIAGAPISWGVCEVPGWGFQLTAERVLGEMADLGLSATEFGPEGFLPGDPAGKAKMLAGNGLRAVGGFVAIVLHDVNADPLPAIRRELAGYSATGGTILILAAATGSEGYDEPRPDLSSEQWTTLLRNLDLIRGIAAEHGVTAVIHPHAGTMIEGPQEIGRVLTGSTIPFCLDTGHFLIGGTDPVAFAKHNSQRIAHVHLKDVDLDLARRVRHGAESYYGAVTQGLYRPLGSGDVDIRSIVASLSAAGYDGWFVLEQDNVLETDPPPGEGPRVDAAESASYLQTLLDSIGDGILAVTTQ